MAIPIQLLLVEDTPDDAQLILRELQNNGYEVEFERVEDEKAMRAALEEKKRDAIICDYSLPSFNAMKALEVLHQSGQDLPFIVVSGTISEENAVNVLKAGAHDFINKGKFARLGPALERELRDAKSRHERRQAEDKLRKSEERFRTFFELGLIGMAITSLSKGFVEVNEELCQLLGYSKSELMEKTWDELTYPDDLPADIAQFEKILSGEIDGYSIEKRFIRKDGSIVYAEISGACTRKVDGSVDLLLSIVQNITQRKQSDEDLQRRDDELRERNNELERLYRASEALLTGPLADLRSMAQAIVTTVLREFQQSNCSLLLLDRETHEVERLAVEGPYAKQVSMAALNMNKPGLVAKCIRTGQLINAADVAREPDYAPNWKSARSEMVIPLKVGSDVIGALDVQSPELNSFDETDERLMTIFAERAALAIERSRLHAQTLKQVDRLNALRFIDLAISSSFDIRLTLNTVLEQVVSQLNVDAVAVLLFQPETGRLEFTLGRGFRTKGIEASSLRPGEGAAGEAAVRRQVVHISDLKSAGDRFARAQLLKDEDFVSYYGVPLITKGEIKGVLEIFLRSKIKIDMEWLNFLDSIGWQTAVAIDNALLFERIQRSNFDLALAYDATIEGWSHAMDLRDKETEGHTLRVTEMTLKLARVMGIPEGELVHVRRGALLHDIGKMGVPDSVLLKPGKLTDEEWEIMRKHPQYAYDMLAPIAYLRPALDIPYCHHEKWDGTGYPRGLAGEQIPLVARLFAVVDVWDAVTSDRPYRKKWTDEQALEYIREQSGKHFDPAVVDIFLREIGRK